MLDRIPIGEHVDHAQDHVVLANSSIVREDQEAAVEESVPEGLSLLFPALKPSHTGPVIWELVSTGISDTGAFADTNPAPEQRLDLYECAIGPVNSGRDALSFPLASQSGQ